MILTEKAAKKIKEIMKSQNLEEKHVRIGIKGYSCSGPNYSFSLDETGPNNEEDDLMEQYEIKLINNKLFTEILSAIEIDYIETEEKTGFVFKNPLQVLGGDCGGGNCCSR